MSLKKIKNYMKIRYNNPDYSLVPNYVIIRPFLKLIKDMPILMFSNSVPQGWQESFIGWKLFKLKSLVYSFVEDICNASKEKEWVKNLKKVNNRENNKNMVSVIIPTFNRSDLLCSRSIPSVLKQTHKNFELIVVGDNCTDDTEKAIKRFSDSRIKFVNLPKRGQYPQNAYLRWLVAGSLPINYGLRIASGDWIAHLDDDDEFLEDHLEVLLKYCINGNYDMVYGIFEMEKPDGSWVKVGTPNLLKGVCRSSSIYASCFKKLEFDINCWKINEPGDYNLYRRMQRAGLKIGFLNSVIGKHYREKTQLNK